VDEAGAQRNPFDQEIRDAAGSAALADLFGTAFDATAPAGVLGFSFVTLSGLAHIADLLARERPRVLLDAGCGWGGPGGWIARRLGSDLIGVDSSAVAVGLARRRDPDSSFVVASLEATGLGDASVDAIVSIDALHLAGAPHAAARELLRVVRPGGSLSVTLWRARSGPERLVRDHAAVLDAAGWTAVATEDHPEWLDAQLRLYAAAEARGPSEPDPAVRRLQREAAAVAPAIRRGRRLLIRARRPA
jgi:SAM-dependent methyltransferase